MENIRDKTYAKYGIKLRSKQKKDWSIIYWLQSFWRKIWV